MNQARRFGTIILRKMLPMLPSLFVLFYFVIPIYLEPKWRTANESFVAEWPLPDGEHRLRLLKIEKGLKTYDWVPSLNGSWLESVYSRPRFPQEIHLKSQFKCPPDLESVGFLFRVVNNHVQWDDSRFFIDRVGLKDSQGFVVGGPFYTTWESGVMLLETTCLPRRDKELTIQIETPNYPNPSKVYEFKMPNPYYGQDFPEWKPDSSLTKTEKGRTLTLHESIGNWNWGNYYYLEESLGLVGKQYCESLITVEDPTGNQGDSLSPFEPVWKVKADVFPLLQKIAPESIRDKIRLKVPLKSNTVLLDQAVTVRGATLKLLAVCGGGAVSNLGTLPFQYELRSRYGDDCAFVVVQPENIQRDEGIAIRSTYREGISGRTLSYRDNGKPIAVKLCQDRHHPKEVALEIAESISQRFEYLVTPPARLRKHWQVDAQPSP